MRRAWIVLAACHAHVPVQSTHVDQAIAHVGKAVAVVELDQAAFVFEPSAITILRGDAVAAHVDTSAVAKPWQAAGTLDAPDDSGRWVVGLAGDGTLFHVTIDARLEPIADRIGLGDRPIRAFGSVGKTFAALTTGNELAITSDGKHMQLFGSIDPIALAVARDRVALGSASAVEVWDLVHATRRTFATPGLIGLVFVGADSALAVLTATGLFVERGGALHPIATPEPPIALAASGARLWLASRSGAVYLVEDGKVAHTDAKPAGELHGSPSGDLWATGASLVRYSYHRVVADPLWEANVKPIFARVCARCHLPGGSAHVDLSTLASWHDQHDDLVHRLVETRTMPPAGTELDEADRKTLADWLAR